MTQADQQNPDGSTRSEGSPSSGPVWVLWLVAGALVFGCVCSLGALFTLRQASDLGWVQSLRPMATQPAATEQAVAPTAAPPLESTPAPTRAALADLPSPTAELASTATLTATSAPGKEPTATSKEPTATINAPTATAVPTRAATAIPATATPPPATATRPPNPTRPPAPTATKTTAAAPTPFICDSLYELANIQELAAGQTFQCTLQQQELTDVASNYPDSPCSEVRFEFDDGEIDVVCRMGVRMQATLAAQVQDCRIGIQVLSGTLGFKQIVQELITTQFNVIRYDSICVDQIKIDNGQLTVDGHGR